MALAFRRHLGIGISLYNDCLEIVRVREQGGTVDILTHQVFPCLHEVYDNGRILDTKRFAVSMKRVFQDLGLPQKGITLSLPSSTTVIRTLMMPRVNRKQMRQMLDFQLRNDIRLPFANPVYDFDYFPTPENNQHEVPILLVASPNDLVTGLNETFRKAGFGLAAIEPKGLSILRALKAIRQSPQEGTIVVEFEAGRVDAHFYVNGGFVMTRSLDVNPEQYVQAAMAAFLEWHGESESETEPGAFRIGREDWTLLDRLDNENGIPSFASDLGYQFERWLSFFHYSLNQRNVTMQHLWLSGQDARTKRLAQHLSGLLNMNVSTISAPNVPSADRATGRRINLSAAGAGLRGMISDAD